MGALPRLESCPELDLHPFRPLDSIEVLADFSSMAGEVGVRRRGAERVRDRQPWLLRSPDKRV